MSNRLMMSSYNDTPNTLPIVRWYFQRKSLDAGMPFIVEVSLSSATDEEDQCFLLPAKLVEVLKEDDISSVAANTARPQILNRAQLSCKY